MYIRTLQCEWYVFGRRAHLPRGWIKLHSVWVNDIIIIMPHMRNSYDIIIHSTGYCHVYRSEFIGRDLFNCKVGRLGFLLSHSLLISFLPNFVSVQPEYQNVSTYVPHYACLGNMPLLTPFPPLCRKSLPLVIIWHFLESLFLVGNSNVCLFHSFNDTFKFQIPFSLKTWNLCHNFCLNFCLI